MYFQDLDICTYHAGPFDGENWTVPLLTVGWLEYPHEFSSGNSPIGLVFRLKQMVEQTSSAYPHYTFRGVAYCSHCVSAQLKSPGPIWSQENIFVPGNDVVYVAPGGIVHYIEAHSYLPPVDFIEPVLRCPDLQSDEYRDALRRANAGVEPPLKTKSQLDSWIRNVQREHK
jgi:hypothetical protein